MCIGSACCVADTHIHTRGRGERKGGGTAEEEEALLSCNTVLLTHAAASWSSESFGLKKARKQHNTVYVGKGVSKCHRGPEEVKCQRAAEEVLLLPRVVTHALTTWVLSMWQLPNQTKLNKLDRYTVTKMPEEGGRLGQCHVCSSQQVKLWAIWVKTLKLWANLNQNTKTNLTQKVVGMERQYVQWVRLHFTLYRGEMNLLLFRWRLAQDAKQLPIALRCQEFDWSTFTDVKDTLACFINHQCPL